MKKEAELREKEAKAQAASEKLAGKGAPAEAPGDASQPPPVAPPPVSSASPPTEPPKPADPTPSGKPTPGKKPSVVVVYAGEYVGSDTSLYNMSGVERSEKDDKARTRVDGSGPDISVTFIDSGSGKDICTLKAKAQGKTATFTAGQKCWANEPVMSGSLTKGTASFDDKKLSIDADFDLQVSEGDTKMSGVLHYHFEGTRK